MTAFNLTVPTTCLVQWGRAAAGGLAASDSGADGSGCQPIVFHLWASPQVAEVAGPTIIRRRFKLKKKTLFIVTYFGIYQLWNQQLQASTQSYYLHGEWCRKQTWLLPADFHVSVLLLANFHVTWLLPADLSCHLIITSDCHFTWLLPATVISLDYYQLTVMSPDYQQRTGHVTAREAVTLSPDCGPAGRYSRSWLSACPQMAGLTGGWPAGSCNSHAWSRGYPWSWQFWHI